MSKDFRTYQAPGPEAARFLIAREPVSDIMGPVGSGKTSAGLIKRLMVAQQQKPWSDGIRRTKHAVIRQTTRELEKTTIPSWLEWVPKEMGHFTGGSGGVMAVHRLAFRTQDGTIVETIVEFIGLGEHRIEDVMRGWQGTTALQDEADLMSPDAEVFIRGRLGRYPPMDLGGPSFYGLDQMFNAPDIDNYLYKHCVEKPQEGRGFYRQPAGLIKVGDKYHDNPHAENRGNLPPGYYLNAAKGQPHWYVRRMILNDWGYSRDGEPVYPEYDDDRHCPPGELEPLDADLFVGGDAGLHPAVVIGQKDSFGQLRVLDELVAPETGMGAQRFGEWLNSLLGMPRYKGLKVAAGFGDPAGNARSDTDEQTWLRVMARVNKFPWRPTQTNQPLLRQEAVRHALVLPLVIDDRAQPGLVLSSRCRVLRKGFHGGYRLQRVLGVNGRVLDEPVKNGYSHPHDALQYLCLGLGYGREAVAGRHHKRPMQVRAITDDEPQGRYLAAPRFQLRYDSDLND